MRETKFTPGPWAYAIADGWTIRHPVIYADAGSIANATFLGPSKLDELNANARLIAAAPELYEALRLLMHEVDESGLGEAHDFGWPRASAAARAALAKARGEA